MRAPPARIVTTSVFFHLEFWLLVLFSVVLPTAIYVGLLYRRAISRVAVLALGVVLVAVSAVDVYLLQTMVTQSKITPSLADDRIFLSEVTLALYLLPLLFAGIGINMISHVLIEHLADAERKFDEEHPHKARRIRLKILRPPRGAGRPAGKPPLVIDETDE
jgi:hypothetical protein